MPCFFLSVVLHIYRHHATRLQAASGSDAARGAPGGASRTVTPCTLEPAWLSIAVVDRQLGHPEIPLQTSVLAIDGLRLLTVPSKAAAQNLALRCGRVSNFHGLPNPRNQIIVHADSTTCGHLTGPDPKADCTVHREARPPEPPSTGLGESEVLPDRAATNCVEPIPYLAQRSWNGC